MVDAKEAQVVFERVAEDTFKLSSVALKLDSGQDATFMLSKGDTLTVCIPLQIVTSF